MPTDGSHVKPHGGIFSFFGHDQALLAGFPNL
jgi:hypothetical protein